MFNSLFIKGEKRLFKEIIELMDKIENCLELFKNFYILIKDNYESNKIDAIFLQINSLETEIDEKRRMIIEEIISGNFFSYIGESLIELLEKIDQIALEAHHGFNSKIVDLLKDSGFSVLNKGQLIYGSREGLSCHTDKR